MPELFSTLPVPSKGVEYANPNLIPSSLRNENAWLHANKKLPCE